MNVEEFGQIPTGDEYESWFYSLIRPLRIDLFVDPERLLTGDHAAEAIRSGKLLAAAWFTSVDDGPAGFALPDGVVDSIEEARAGLDEWWSRLSDSQKEAWRELGDGPLPAALETPYPAGYLLPIRGYEPQHADLVVVDYVEAWRWRTTSELGNPQ